MGVLSESLYLKKFIRTLNGPKTNQARNCFVFNMVFGYENNSLQGIYYNVSQNLHIQVIFSTFWFLDMLAASLMLASKRLNENYNDLSVRFDKLDYFSLLLLRTVFWVFRNLAVICIQYTYFIFQFCCFLYGLHFMRLSNQIRNNPISILYLVLCQGCSYSAVFFGSFRSVSCRKALIIENFNFYI